MTNIDWNTVNSEFYKRGEQVRETSFQLEHLADVLKDRVDTSEWSEIAKDLLSVSEKIKKLRKEN